MKHIPKIDDLHSMTARNFLRGMIGNSSHAEMIELLMKIRSNCSESDFKTALEIIRSRAMFKGNLISRDFNKSFPKPINGNVQYDTEHILAKINQNSAKLTKLLQLAENALQALANYDPHEALRQCQSIVIEEGVSIFLLRVLYFIRNHFGEDLELAREVDRIFLEIKIYNISYLSLAIRELTSSKTDYLNICEKINASEDSALVQIAKSFVDHIPRSGGIFAGTLAAYYGISLFDALIYYCSVQRLRLPFANALEEPLLEKYNRITSVHLNLADYYNTAEDNLGLDVFRESFLLIELYCCLRYKTAHGAIFNSTEHKELRRIPFEKLLLTEHFIDVKNMSTIGNATESTMVCLEKYKREHACFFENSNALVYSLERNDGGINNEELDFVRLMSKTRDIGTICPIHYIENIRRYAIHDELKLVATCLSYIKQKSQLKEHELRAIIQEVSIRKYESHFTRLLEDMYRISPAVTEHLIQTCDETFLSKLFQLVKNPNRAIEERAEILEWYGNRVGDLTFLERAKNLRIDVQINREKGTIDDSRIYVDPVKFTQWVNDQVISHITILLDALPSGTDAGVVVLNWDKVKTGIAPLDQIGNILLISYEEFCSNKIFGIASYLGRRIRHGTLKGTGLNDVKNFASDPKYRKLFLVREFDDAYKNWINEYENAINQLRDRYLHIQDKSKPDGMILKDFRSASNKIAANHMVHDVIKSFENNKNGLELPYIITEYCWRLIEEDLANIRRFLMEKKAKYAVFRFEASNDVNLKQREVQEFCQDLHSVTAEKFRTISSWFNKPSIASPSADIVLLFRAVVSEIKGFFTDYSPVIIVDESDFKISGGQYFAIYDALYILIYNAAKYGMREGLLSMTVGFKENSGKTSLHLTIISQIAADDTMNEVQDSIHLALEGDCEDALVMEGRSGIKKLRRMEQDNYIGDVMYEFRLNTIVASFSFAINY